MASNFIVDTGSERHVVGHFVSGAVAGAIVGGTLNYTRYKNDEITKVELLNTTAKTTVQAGIGTAAAISAANNMGKGNWLGVLTSVGLGVVGVYATEKFYDKLELNYSKDKTIEQKV